MVYRLRMIQTMITTPMTMMISKMARNKIIWLFLLPSSPDPDSPEIVILPDDVAVAPPLSVTVNVYVKFPAFE